MKRTKRHMIVDLQFGSTGKGLIAQRLANYERYGAVVNANRPNAGHTWRDRGDSHVFTVLPVGSADHRTEKVFLGPGSAFTEEKLREDLDAIKKIRVDTKYLVFIHPMAWVVRKEHLKQEKEIVERIGSTGKGSGASLAEKIGRKVDSNAGTYSLLLESTFPNVMVLNSHMEWLDLLSVQDNILIEGAQGYSLGIDHGVFPYVTSRNCTATAFEDACGLPRNYVDKVIGCLRTYPIRVAGNSGPTYPDSREMSWEELDVKPEYTSVTKKKRRVFTFSEMQIKEAIEMNQPDELFINFCNYMNDRELFQLRNTLMKYMDGETPIYQGWGNNPDRIYETYLYRLGEDI